MLSHFNIINDDALVQYTTTVYISAFSTYAPVVYPGKRDTPIAPAVTYCFRGQRKMAREAHFLSDYELQDWCYVCTYVCMRACVRVCLVCLFVFVVVYVDMYEKKWRTVYVNFLRNLRYQLAMFTILIIQKIYWGFPMPEQLIGLVD